MSLPTRKTFNPILAGLFLLLLAACGGHDKPVQLKPADPFKPLKPDKIDTKPSSVPLPGAPTMSSSPRQLSFTLVTRGTVPGLSKLKATIQTVAFLGADGQWHPVQLPVTSLKVQFGDGGRTVLAEREQLPKGIYTAVRFTFNASASVVRSDGFSAPLLFHPDLATVGIPLQAPIETSDHGHRQLDLILDLPAALASSLALSNAPMLHPPSLLVSEQPLPPPTMAGR